MKSRIIACVTGTLVCMLAAPTFAQSPKDWVDIKNPQELRELYSNKTFRGNGWVGHYRADGKGILITEGGKKSEPRTWEVKGNDQVCTTTPSGATRCSRFQRSVKNRNQLLVILSDGTSLNFTLEEGVPKF